MFLLEGLCWSDAARKQLLGNGRRGAMTGTQSDNQLRVAEI